MTTAIGFVGRIKLLSRYKRLRARLGTIQNHIIASLTDEQFAIAARRLGMDVGDASPPRSEMETYIVVDHAIYDCTDDGDTPVARYLRDHPGEPGTEDKLIADAMRQARYSILKIEDGIPGLGVTVHELGLGRGFLADISMSHTIRAARGELVVARILRLPEFWMTTGAALPVATPAAAAVVSGLAEEIARVGTCEEHGSRSDEVYRRLALSVIRAGLSAGVGLLTNRIDPNVPGDLRPHALRHIQEASPEPGGRRFAIKRSIAAPAHTSANAPCPCGSGRKYKKCCGNVGVR